MLTLTPSKDLQRARGKAALGFGLRDGRTVLSDLHQSGCVKALLPRNHASRVDAVLINTSGGVTGGDRLDYCARLEEGASLCLTTQTAERIYKSSSGAGVISTKLELAAFSAMDWLPQETILFDGSALDRHLDVSMSASSSALLLEAVVLGRKAMGETLKRCDFCDQWRVMREGKLVYADALRLRDPAALGGRATLENMRAFATLVYISLDAEDRRDQMAGLLSFDDVRASTSAWNGCLVTRFIAPDAQPLRAALIATLSQFRAHPLPRVWNM
ncbi:urease accessory protein UreD [uncultured Cohaesibacter sp.]|uniref:urease accessory protein UreD n=1 Tax=uncultured Cohaesibacter sp. TaxID=1002546 RepID=UPI0029307E87|nr:urease accessory protein UreD [uncultured Cohaesibacter sp.]